MTHTSRKNNGCILRYAKKERQIYIMDKIYGFFGTVLGVFYGGSESLVASCILVCMIIKLLFVTMTNK